LALGCNTPLAVPYSELNATINLPDKRPFPIDLKHVGDHIKYKRLAENILIKDVIEQIQIDRETLRGWELGLFEPLVHQYPQIIKFLGYFPFAFDTNTIAGKIKTYRYKNGLTQKEFGALLQKDGSVIWEWESNGRKPISKFLKQILELIES
jgi:hypothetical protein